MTFAVLPHYTRQECSSCGQVVKQSFSTRTHICKCGCELNRDRNPAISILQRGLSTVGYTGTLTLGDISPLASLDRSCDVTAGGRTKNPRSFRAVSVSS
ncbi:transposase [Oxynema sp. CENA135]|nr:transposase [Oxynema sp. CENA135]